jgi:hypothetical protein
MKRYFFLCVALLMFPVTSHAVKPPPAKPYVAPSAIPATIEGFIYVTGYPSLDTDKYLQRIRYQGRFELGTDSVVFKRTRARQDGKRGVEDVDIGRFRYADIEKLYFGDEAIKQAATGQLPTASKRVFDRDWGIFVSLEKYITRRTMSPVVIIYKQDGKSFSLIVLAYTPRAKALYDLLKSPRL